MSAERRNLPAVVEASTPVADVERALPFVAAIGNHAVAAADTGVVEQQVDLVGLVLALLDGSA